MSHLNRTVPVNEQSIEKLPSPSGIDVTGDTRWIYEFYRLADSLNMEGFLALHTEDVRLTFSNYPSTMGQKPLREAIGGLWSRIKGMSHTLSGVWSLHDGRLGIAEGSCRYTRLDDTFFTVKTCTVLRRRGDDGKIADLRIHVDVNGL